MKARVSDVYGIPAVRITDEVAGDVELTTKLQEEIQYEQEAAAQAGDVPEFVQEFKSGGVWKVR